MYKLQEYFVIRFFNYFNCLVQNSTLLMSLYSVHHDRQKWDNPEAFCPERFLDKDGKFNSVEDLYFFGFGNQFNSTDCFVYNVQNK